MHAAALTLMEQALCRVNWPIAKLLDVGSFDVNGTFRPLVEGRAWIYTGLDIRPGPNVDIVSLYPYHFPADLGPYHAVICGNMLHNCSEPWKLVPEMVRALRPGGLLAIVTLTWSASPQTGYPIDAWRFMPDGLRVLFDNTGCLHKYEISSSGGDIVASAFKMRDWD